MHVYGRLEVRELSPNPEYVTSLLRNPGLWENQSFLSNHLVKSGLQSPTPFLLPALRSRVIQWFNVVFINMDSHIWYLILWWGSIWYIVTFEFTLVPVMVPQKKRLPDRAVEVNSRHFLGQCHLFYCSFAAASEDSQKAWGQDLPLCRREAKEWCSPGE